jgi:CYTH domain-containing protein
MHTEWEFERKFIVTFVPDGLLDTRKPVSIRQGYLASEHDKHIRIRDEGGEYTMTVKQGVGLKRRDTRIELTESQFGDLWPLTQNMRVEKLRYRIDFYGVQLVFDVFTGNLSPLKLVEVEFDSEISSRQFLPPDFADVEVTHRREFQNVALARYGLPDRIVTPSATMTHRISV